MSKEEEQKVPEDNKQTSTDKRKLTSKKNVEKARAAKLEKLKQKRENDKNKYEICSDSDSSDSESEDEVIIVKGKNKHEKKKPDIPTKKPDNVRDEINELKQMIQNLTIKKRKKRKEPKSKQVIQFVNPTVQPKSNPELDGLKQRILVNF